MRLFVILLLALFGCVKEPVVYTLPPPASLPSTSLIPDGHSAASMDAGACLTRDSVVLSPELAAGLAAELKRLKDVPAALQSVEREQAGVVIGSANKDIQKRYKRQQWVVKWTAPVLVVTLATGIVVGVVAAGAVASAVP